MSIAAGIPESVAHGTPILRDALTKTMEQSWDELFSMDREELEAFQLRGIQDRFEQQQPLVRVLAAQAESASITALHSLNDVVPLLFQHSTYKSYPMSLLEKNRFELLTQWLDGLTSLDLSSVKTRDCGGIDEWLEALEQQTPLQPFHTSGTTGKLSFFPRTTLERDLWMDNYLKLFEGFGEEPDTRLGKSYPRLSVIYPSVRNGRFVAQRLVKFLAENVAPTPEQCYTLSNGTLSADLVSLSGRIRVAQAKGNLSGMKLSDAMRAALKRYLEEQQRRPAEMAAFFTRMNEELRGQRVLLTSQTSYLLQASQEGLRRGLSGVFAPDSIGTIGGGGKDVVLPNDWQEQIRRFTGVPRFAMSYGMTEINVSIPQCPHGFYHLPPYTVAFLLNPETGQPLPRSGQQTGQFACVDLLAQTYWGGVVSSDKVTIEWDRACGCGRKGPHIHDPITRYDSSVTGDDKVTCAATVDNTDAALQQLLGD